MRATDIIRQRRGVRRADSRGQWLLRAAAIIFLLVLLALVAAPLAGVAASAAGLLSLTRDLPDVALLEQLPDRFSASPATTRLYALGEPDADGARPPVLIDEIADPRLGGAGWVRFEDLPAYVPGAYLAATDPNFISAAPPLIATIAGWWNSGQISDASSPIVRQLIQTHLRQGAADPSGDPRRLFQNWFLAEQIERRYSREQLLEWALNTTYYGNLAYGVEAAARVYFGKGATDLTPGEAATLAAVAQNPAANPFDDPAARRGGAAVLEAMEAMGLISAGEVETARATPLALAPPPGSGSAAPQYARLARGELEAILGPERLLAGGLEVETTLDAAQQSQAECAAWATAATRAGDSAGPSSGPPCQARGYLSEPSEPAAGGEINMAVVVLDPITGEIEALFGDATTPQPIGTLVQPLIYLTALSRGYTAASVVLDVAGIPAADGAYTPTNSDGRFFGPLRLRQALAAGRTIAAAQVLSWVGADQVRATARALGLRPGEAQVADDMSFVERGLPATLLDVGQAFAAIDNGVATGTSFDGAAPRPATIRRVTDAGGQELYAYEPATRETLTPELAYLLTDMLADPDARCPAFGCPNALELPDGRPAAVTTGASAAGGWAVGYTPDHLIGVLAQGEGATGIADAAPLWRALMAEATGGVPVAEWSRPVGLRSVEVCQLSGLLPARDVDCPAMREWFIPGTEPAAADTTAREVAVNRETGRLATIFTPPQLVERHAYTVYPLEAAAWAAEAGIEAPPSEYDTIRHVPTRSGGTAVLSPEPFEVVGGQWPVIGSAGGDDFAYYRLAYFPGLLPEAMQILVDRGESPVDGGELAVWDTALVDDGLYTLLLTVVRQNGTFDEVAIPVRVENE